MWGCIKGFRNKIKCTEEGGSEGMNDVTLCHSLKSEELNVCILVHFGMHAVGLLYNQ